MKHSPSLKHPLRVILISDLERFVHDVTESFASCCPHHASKMLCVVVMQQTKIAITTAVQLAGINSPICYSLGYYLLISNSAPSDEL